MPFDNFTEDPYEPDEAEIRELNEILRQEKKPYKPNNRLTFDFYTESHFAGWLRTHGIRW
jgi:hypothetical protein